MVCVMITAAVAWSLHTASASGSLPPRRALLKEGRRHLAYHYYDEGERIVQRIGSSDHHEAKEISGVVASRRHVKRTKDGKDSGVLWSHNDSGSAPYVFALNASTGANVAWFELVDAPSEDWEDIAIGSGPEFGVDYLYIGDFGGKRRDKMIIRFPEPDLAALRSNGTFDPYDLVPVTDYEVIHFRFPSGKVSDIESLTVDPLSGDILIIAKHSSRLDVYVLHQDASLRVGDEGVNELRLHYSSCNDAGRTGTSECEHCRGCTTNTADFNTHVAADISPSGHGLIVSDYRHVWHWRRRFLNESFFDSEPTQLPYQNHHGTEEALCWSADSLGYYVIPEVS